MVVPARQQAEADGAVPAALAAVGLATVSTAVTLLAAACNVDDAYYYRLALISGIFLAGVTLVGASVWVSDNTAARRAAGKKLLHAAVPPLLATVGLMVAALLW